MKPIFTIFLLTCFLSVISQSVYAETFNSKLRILPIDCVFEVIDIGTQQLRFLTPETCPSEPIPPVVEPPGYNSKENPITIKPAYYIQVEPTPSLGNPQAIEKPRVASGEASKHLTDLIDTSLDSKIFAFVTIGFLTTIFLLAKRNKRNR